MRISDWSSDVCSSDLLTNETPRIGFVRELIRYESKEIISAPPRVKPWVYCSQVDELFNIVNRTQMTRAEFNVSHARDRKSVVEGKSVSVSVDRGGRRTLKKIKHTHTEQKMLNQ